MRLRTNAIWLAVRKTRVDPCPGAEIIFRSAVGTGDTSPGFDAESKGRSDSGIPVEHQHNLCLRRRKTRA